ncbi:MAG: ribosome maturation factor RimP [Thermodesulfovibrionales bacterium]
MRPLFCFMSNRLEEKIQDLAKKVAEDYGYDLVEVNLLGKGKRTLLRVYIDKEGGVTLNDCEFFSRRFENILDIEDPIQGPYTLEVSSPGLNRPLRKIEDFRKNIGRMIRVITRQKIDNQTFFIGRITDVTENFVHLHAKEGKKEVIIPLEVIDRANLEIEIK